MFASEKSPLSLLQNCVSEYSWVKYGWVYMGNVPHALNKWGIDHWAKRCRTGRETLQWVQARPEEGSPESMRLLDAARTDPELAAMLEKLTCQYDSPAWLADAAQAIVGGDSHMKFCASRFANLGCDWW